MELLNSYLKIPPNDFKEPLITGPDSVYDGSLLLFEMADNSDIVPLVFGKNHTRSSHKYYAIPPSNEYDRFETTEREYGPFLFDSFYQFDRVEYLRIPIDTDYLRSLRIGTNVQLLTSIRNDSTPYRVYEGVVCGFDDLSIQLSNVYYYSYNRQQTYYINDASISFSIIYNSFLTYYYPGEYMPRPLTFDDSFVIPPPELNQLQEVDEDNNSLDISSLPIFEFDNINASANDYTAIANGATWHFHNQGETTIGCLFSNNGTHSLNLLVNSLGDARYQVVSNSISLNDYGTDPFLDAIPYSIEEASRHILFPLGIYLFSLKNGTNIIGQFVSIDSSGLLSINDPQPLYSDSLSLSTMHTTSLNIFDIDGFIDLYQSANSFRYDGVVPSPPDSNSSD